MKNVSKIAIIFYFFCVFFSQKIYTEPISRENKNFFILSIDGGGVRGIIPAIILKYIEDRIDTPLCKKFDVIAGSSTGAIIAAGLSVPNHLGAPLYRAYDIINLYKYSCNRIFQRSIFRQIFTLDGWIGPKYSKKYAKKLYKEIFENHYISSTLTEIMIPALDVRSNKVHFFSTFRGKEGLDYPLYKVILAATSAPTYFPSVKITLNLRTYEYVDAGCAINNPSVDSYILAMYKTKNSNSNNFLILSLGTGSSILGTEKRFLTRQGKLDWASNLIGLVMNASSHLSEKRSSFFFDLHNSFQNKKENYFRIQVELPHSCSYLDNCSEENLKNLEIYAYKAIEDNKDKIIRILNNKNKNKI